VRPCATLCRHDKQPARGRGTRRRRPGHAPQPRGDGMTLPDASVAAAIAAIPPGNTLDPTTSPSALQTFINSLPSNSVGYLRGGTYASASASGTVRMNGTGVILKPYPGELVTYS